MVFFAATAYIYGRTTLALLPATVAGGLAAFLCYNFHPAKVFMGDTGSLFLGGMVCGMAFALDMPLILHPGRHHLHLRDAFRHPPGHAISS